jgi:hypothetical protein
MAREVPRSAGSEGTRKSRTEPYDQGVVPRHPRVGEMPYVGHQNGETLKTRRLSCPVSS